MRVILADGTSRSAVLTAAALQFTIPQGATTGADAFRRYIRLGLDHILGGLDHVLFLLALTWQATAFVRARATARPVRSLLAELAKTATEGVTD